MIATRALALARTHSAADIAEAVAAGRMQEWGSEDSVLITEIRDTPLARYLHFFLAEGHLPEIQAMLPPILDWGRAMSCTRASLVGREGWRRVPWLVESGWSFKHICMEREL